MNVHNLMEEIVTQTVNELYDHATTEKAKWLSCDCENCRLDTISYVLNRIPPKYVVSGRGATHATKELSNGQIKADIEGLAIEGMRIVNTTKRPFHTNNRKDNEIQTSRSPAFNFSTFSGTILDGNTFEPVTGAHIVLRYNGKPAEMVDKTWANPFTTVKSTNGIYSFWVKSIPTPKAGVTKVFGFALEVSAPEYADQQFHFDIPVTSEEGIRDSLDQTYSVKLQDFLMFKK